MAAIGSCSAPGNCTHCGVGMSGDSQFCCRRSREDVEVELFSGDNLLLRMMKMVLSKVIMKSQMMIISYHVSLNRFTSCRWKM